MKQPRVSLSTMHPYLLLILILFFCLSSCSNSKESPLQMEAEEKAEQWFDKVVIKCGDDYFAKPDPKNKSLLFQLKNPYYDLKELKKTYTESDRLNGEVYEWYGAVDVHSTQYRQILPGEQGRWSEGTVTVYGTPFISKVLSKKNGQWNVDAETGSKFDCSDIPQ